jgi:hypothetical protein
VDKAKGDILDIIDDIKDLVTTDGTYLDRITNLETAVSDL